MKWLPISDIPEALKIRDRSVLLYDGSRLVSGPYFTGYYQRGRGWTVALDGLTTLNPTHFMDSPGDPTE
jgi:hypothetical protein